MTLQAGRWGGGGPLGLLPTRSAIGPWRDCAGDKPHWNRQLPGLLVPTTAMLVRLLQVARASRLLEGAINDSNRAPGRWSRGFQRGRQATQRSSATANHHAPPSKSRRPRICLPPEPRSHQPIVRPPSRPDRLGRRRISDFRRPCLPVAQRNLVSPAARGTTRPAVPPAASRKSPFIVRDARLVRPLCRASTYELPIHLSYFLIASTKKLTSFCVSLDERLGTLKPTPPGSNKAARGRSTKGLPREASRPPGSWRVPSPA